MRDLEQERNKYAAAYEQNMKVLMTFAHIMNTQIAHVDEPEETQAILKALEAEFGLTHRTVTDLLERARKESAGASDMFPYTHLLNQRLDHEQKCRILTAMWRVAFADGNVDKYEEHLIRRVHELLHVEVRAQRHYSNHFVLPN